MKSKVAERYLRKASGDIQWGIDQIQGALGILKDVVDVWDNGVGKSPSLAEKFGEVAKATKAIRGPISKGLGDQVANLRKIGEKKTAARKPGYLTPQEKRLVNRVLHAEGLGGAKKFEKPVLGVTKALDVLKDYNLQPIHLVSSHHFSTTLEQYNEPMVEHRDHWDEQLEITNPNDDSTIPVMNSVLVLYFTKLHPHNYEVMAYIS